MARTQERQTMSPEDDLSHAPDATVQHGPIPDYWLCEPVDVHEVEENIAGACMSDAWLNHWSALLRGMQPGDELWDYHHFEEGPRGEVYDSRSGYAVVRDGRVNDHIGEPFESRNW